MHFLIRTPSRIHMSLIDLNGKVGRIDGGLGFGINEPHFDIEFRDDHDPSIEKGNEGGTLENQENLIKIEEKIITFYGRQSHAQLFQEVFHKMMDEYHLTPHEFTVKINNIIPCHQGFGSKTQLLLGFARGIAEMYNISPPISELTKLVGRGGTSGIGYQVFERGGFYIDLGHTFGPKKQKNSFLPSSAASAPPGLPFFHIEFPSHWKIFIIHPELPHKIADHKEISIFSKFTPISQREVEVVSHRILFQVIPGLIEKDLRTLADGVNAINQNGFKKIEISLQPTFMAQLLTEIYREFHIPCGLSSFGPVLYAIADDSIPIENFTRFIAIFRKKTPEVPLITVSETNPNNHGALITHLS